MELGLVLQGNLCIKKGLKNSFSKRYGCTPKQYRKNHNKKSEIMNTSITSLQYMLPFGDSLTILNQYLLGLDLDLSLL